MRPHHGAKHHVVWHSLQDLGILAVQVKSGVGEWREVAASWMPAVFEISQACLGRWAWQQVSSLIELLVV